jgi:pentatricopeptide repeat protein
MIGECIVDDTNINTNVTTNNNVDNEDLIINSLCREKQTEEMDAFLEELRYGIILNSPVSLDLPTDLFVDIYSLKENDDWKEQLSYNGRIDSN